MSKDVSHKRLVPGNSEVSPEKNYSKFQQKNSIFRSDFRLEKSVFSLKNIDFTNQSLLRKVLQKTSFKHFYVKNHAKFGCFYVYFNT